MLSRTELEYHSIFTYLKEGVLARYFSQEVQNEPLSYDPNLYDGKQRTDYLIVNPATSLFGKKISSAGSRGWLSFELNELNPSYIYNETVSGYVPTYNTPFFNYSFTIPTKREASYIKVRDQFNNVMDRDWYQIDYKNCRIRFPAPTTPSGVVASGLIPTKVDYRVHNVALLDGWPTDDNIPDLPFISFYAGKQNPEGFQLGGGVEFNREYYIDIFATDNANKRQLIDIIQQSLFNKHATAIDFNRGGFPLNHWGTINQNFIQTIPDSGNNYETYLTLNPGNGQLLYFLNIEVLYDTSPRGVMANAMRHIAKIRFDTCSYSDRDPELVGKFSGLKEPAGGFDSLTKRAYTA